MGVKKKETDIQDRITHTHTHKKYQVSTMTMTMTMTTINSFNQIEKIYRPRLRVLMNN